MDFRVRHRPSFSAFHHPINPVKLLIIGNCQARQFARCLHVILPGAEIRSLNYGPGLERILPLAAKMDVVVCQRTTAVPILEVLDRIRIDCWIPRIIFNAFHPDQLMINAPAGKIASAPIAGHSALALTCWKNGVPEEAAVDWFHPEIFRQLGYDHFLKEATDSLCREGDAVGFQMAELIGKWLKNGCFMHIAHHPKIEPLADVAVDLVKRMGLEPATHRPADLMCDQMANGPIWPVYPGIAEAFGMKGNYCFKVAQKDPQVIGNPEVLDLRTFVARSYATFRESDPEALTHPRFSRSCYEELGQSMRRSQGFSGAGPAKELSAPPRHPYQNLPDFHFWKRSVADPSYQEVDPVVSLPWRIGAGDVICTAGSCFAQHIASTLAKAGLNYRNFEPAPGGCSEEKGRTHGYGVFSARYANLYTTRQLRQLFERAFGTFEPAEAPWQRLDGKWADPFRPEIEPDGFSTADEVVAARETHFAAVREMFRSLDVFIFTLGLTETWQSREDGAVFPLAPGVVAGKYDKHKHAFANFTKEDVLHDLQSFFSALRSINPKARMILTVSPVPLAATFEDRSVLVSTHLSKSVLRVACDEFVRENPDSFYFPSYEIVSGSFHRGRYFAADLRTVTQEGVNHVMRLFVQHGVDRAALPGLAMAQDEGLMDIICEEENLDAD